MEGANEADISLIIFDLGFNFPQFCKGVNNNSENDIEQNNVNNHEAGHIIKETDNILASVALPVRFSYHHITDASGRSWSLNFKVKIEV